MINENKKGNFKNVASTCLGLGLGAFAIVGVFGLVHNIKSSNNGYSQEQYEQQYINGYNDGYKNSFKDKENLQGQLSVCINDYNNLKNSYDLLFEQASADKQLLSEIEPQLEETLSQLNDYKQQIDYYCSIYKDFAIESYNKVTFVSESNNFAYSYVESGKTPIIYISPVKDKYYFVGWAENENSDEIVDLEHYVVNGDTTLYAVFKPCLNAEFYVGESQFGKVYADKTGIISFSKIPQQEGKTFKGWSTNGVDIYDFSKPITENLVFVAVFELLSDGVYSVNFKVADSDINLNYSITCLDNEIINYSGNPLIVNKSDGVFDFSYIYSLKNIYIYGNELKFELSSVVKQFDHHSNLLLNTGETITNCSTPYNVDNYNWEISNSTVSLKDKTNAPCGFVFVTVTKT